MKVISVNVGQPRDNPWKTIKLTGIDKRPVEGPVMVTAPRAKSMGMVGLAGDRVYDVREHGGPDRAVYAYPRGTWTSGPPSWAGRCRTECSARTSPPRAWTSTAR
jgi:MOSC domain-containing protein YiiM